MSIGKDVDLELWMSSCSPNILGTPTGPKPSRKYTIALQSFNGSSNLVDVDFQEDANGDLHLNAPKDQTCAILGPRN